MLKFQRFFRPLGLVSREGPRLSHMLLLNTYMKSYLANPRALLVLTLSNIERSKTRLPIDIYLFISQCNSNVNY